MRHHVLPRSLHGRLVALLLALLLGLGLASLVGLLRGSRHFSEEVHFRLDHDVAAHLAETERFFEDGEVATERLKALFMHVMVINPSLEVYLVDPAGNVIAYDAPEERIVRRRVDLAPVRTFLAAVAGPPVRGDDPRSVDGKKPISVHPIEVEGQPMGYLYIILGGQDYDSIFATLQQNYSVRYATLFLGGIIAVALIVGIFTLGLLTRPLRRLRREVVGYRAESEAGKAAPGSGNELLDLERSFTAMGRRIDEQLDELQAIDERRREFVAGVSHDLRTPTGAVQGYLETLVDRRDRLTSAEHDQYLRVALRQTRRLAGLVDQLFELARLEAQEGVPQKELFSLAELVQDIVLEYQATAEGKGLFLRARFPYDLPPVHADIALIERALQNLIDNALRYTGPEGEVVVGLTAVDGGVEISVSDAGPGIPAPEIPRLFDRFYRLPQAEPEGARGAGLGLAITRRIVVLHDSTIKVRSRLEEGTTFSFVLATPEGDAADFADDFAPEQEVILP